MSTLTRAAILAANDAEIRTVAVPEWGGDVCVRVMNGTQRDQFESAIAARRGVGGEMDAAGLRALLVCLCACDLDGAPLFTRDDLPALEAKSAAVLQRIFDAAAALNGLTPDAAEQAKSDFTPGRS